jgi:pyroglutamyl-peptidase
VRAFARIRRPALDGVSIAAYVFPTRYGSVDRALPRLLKKHRPDAVLMFGLATRSRTIRIETQARNRISFHPDAGGYTRGPGTIEVEAPRTLPVRAGTAGLLRAALKADLPARLSKSAGQYLCNYLLWQATRAAEAPRGPKLAAFIHVPPLSERVTMQRLMASSEAILQAAVSSLRRGGDPRRA